MNNVIRWLGHVLKVNRGFLLFALAVYGIFGMVTRAHAVEPPGPSGAWTSGSSPNGIGNTYSSSVVAKQACITWTGWWVSNGAPTYRLTSAAAGGGGCGPEFSNGIGLCYYGAVDNPNISDSRAGYFCGPVPPPEQGDNCEEMAELTNGGDNDNIQTWTFNAATDGCKGGCAYGPQGASTSVTFGGEIIVSGNFGFSGLACNVVPASPKPAVPPTPPTTPVCKSAGSGQTFCISQDNKHCYTASTGRDICWTPGETGTKTDGAVAQVRAPGSGTPAAPTPPPGETMTGLRTPTTVTSTSSGTNTTTTVQNYITVNGTNAGTLNQGQSSSQTQAGGSGGTVGGTGDCSSQVTCSGGDAIACATLVEAHQTRCATEKFSKEMTSGEVSALDGNGDGENPASAEAAGLHEESEFDSGDLDKAGFLSGSRSCPNVPDVTFYGHVVPMPNETLCLWLSIGSYLILAFAGLACLRIINGA